VRQPGLPARGLPQGAAGLALLAAGSVWAHGGAAAREPWVEGAGTLAGEPASVLVLLALALLLAQAGQPVHARSLGGPGHPRGLLGALAGLLAGSVAAAAGAVVDVTLVLYGLGVGIGALVAAARRWPGAVTAPLAALACSGAVLMLMPAETPSLAFRAGWVAGVLAAVVLLLGALLAALRVLLGRRPGPVRQMLVRVAGSWCAAAALLAMVLEVSRRAA